MHVLHHTVRPALGSGLVRRLTMALSCAAAITAHAEPARDPGMPAALSWSDTSPAWSGPGEKLRLTGVIYEPDGVTPASDVVLYYYQTNTDGRYIHDPSEPRSMPPNEMGHSHGRIRGWVRTGPDGRYEINTIRPGAYPTGDEPAHIHATIHEPGGAEYYIDDFVFDDDPLLTTQRRRGMENRAGSGVLRLVRIDDVLVGERDVFLGRNIPNHPNAPVRDKAIGRGVGEDVFSFIPFHAWGDDKGTRACPVCAYGWYHGVLYFVGNNPDWDDIRAWLTFLEAESARRADRLKVYFVYADAHRYSKAAREQQLERLGRELGLERVALTFVPSLDDRESDVALNQIDPEVASAFILYKRSRIIATASNLEPNDRSFAWIREQLDRSKNELFDRPK